MRKSLIVIMLLGLCGAAQAHESGTRPGPTTEWRAGYEYSVLIPWSPPDDVVAGQVEVHELFMYTSSWSKAIQPYLERWLASKSGIKYVREPAIAYPHAREQARLYYTLKALGREDLHLKFFDFIRDKDRYPVYHTIRRPAVEAIEDLNIAFARENGVDPNSFIEVYESREIDNQVIEAGLDVTRYALNGTSTIVIGGRYSTSLQRFLGADPASADRRTPEASDYDRFFKMLDRLIEDARNDKSAPPTGAPTAPRN